MTCSLNGRAALVRVYIHIIIVHIIQTRPGVRLFIFLLNNTMYYNIIISHRTIYDDLCQTWCRQNLMVTILAAVADAAAFFAALRKQYNIRSCNRERARGQ